MVVSLRMRLRERINVGIGLALLVAKALHWEGGRLQRRRSRSADREIIRRRDLSWDGVGHQLLKGWEVLLPKPSLRSQEGIGRLIERCNGRRRIGKGKSGREIMQLIERVARSNRIMPLSKSRVTLLEVGALVQVVTRRLRPSMSISWPPWLLSFLRPWLYCLGRAC